MADKVLPRDVADTFVKQYYTILGKSPENVHKFYAESSMLGWLESDGVITPVTTLSAINEKILSSNYKNCFAEVHNVDAQASHDGGVFVAVTGSFLKKDEETTIFCQTFFLARQEKGFFILNDVLRVFDAYRPGADDAPTVQSDASHISVLEDTVAKVSLSASSVASSKKALSVAEPASNANDIAPAANVNVSPAVAPTAKESVPSSIAPAAKESVPSAVAPAAKVDVKPVVEPAANVAPKITYATVVAKMAHVSSPRASPVTPKASAPFANGAQKPLALVKKAATKSTTGNNSAPDTNARSEARRIYLGNLPYDVTKQRVAEVLRKFGPVSRYPNSVQLKKHSNDGYCCAFVEFESPESARLAVEARNVNFDEKVAYIAYKTSSYNRDQGLLQGAVIETTTKIDLTKLGLLNVAHPRVKGQDKRVEILD
ncbi:hypothetical protein CASFOL_024227 [Castilleja foliolosa]|uniref:G3BP-like protein n=1 Tax=Castilleja foliolosa TaxID=1961234 RepID=A0ABD3CMR1_9LAMI